VHHISLKPAYIRAKLYGVKSHKKTVLITFLKTEMERDSVLSSRLCVIKYKHCRMLHSVKFKQLSAALTISAALQTLLIDDTVITSKNPIK
jgi:hypothetical protein